jgi:D-serine deaminase-like pyridoxal phosphate-dependent protein
MNSNSSWDGIVGKPVDELDTPAVLIDLDRVDRNIARMHGAVAADGVNFRAHIKTHKSPDIAWMQIAAGAVGISSAKVSEAEVFVDAGIEDVVLAYPIYGEFKWDRAARLAQRTRLTVHVENEAALDGWSKAAARAGVELDVRVEINTGMNRCGVQPEDALGLISRVEATPRLRLDGITTHRSAFFAAAGGRPPEQLGTEEGVLLVDLAESLRGHGVEITTVSGGSSPTARSVATVQGITEVTAGTYVFYDAGMRDLGVCAHDDIAISLLCTVVSVDGRRITVDGGSKTFTKDGYSSDVAVFGRAVTGGTYLAAVSEEHGMAQLGESDPVPTVGDKLPFHPMHVCPVVNLTDTLIGTRKDVVQHVFSVPARGKTQ